jgi:hypothetical protein
LDYPLGVATKFRALKNKFSNPFSLLVVCVAFLASSLALLAVRLSAYTEKYLQGAEKPGQ